MPAQYRRPAHLDGTHDTQVLKRQGVAFPICWAVMAEDIRYLDAARRPHQRFR
jgi:hypothetical protein